MSIGQLEPRWRWLLAGVGGGLVAAGAWATLSWMSSELDRLSVLEADSIERLTAMQEHVVEFNNLKNRASPPALSGSSLLDEIRSSLRSHQLSLSIDNLDAQRIQVRGEAAFDAVMHWIGSAQQSHRLSLVSMSAVNRGGGASFDLVLTSAPE